MVNIFIVILALACGGLSLFVSSVQNVYRIFFSPPPPWLIIGRDLSREKLREQLGQEKSGVLGRTW